MVHEAESGIDPRIRGHHAIYLIIDGIIKVSRFIVALIQGDQIVQIFAHLLLGSFFITEVDHIFGQFFHY
jgi:hypothetical protein